MIDARVMGESTAAVPAPAQLRLSHVLSALSYALDLTEGHPPGHTLGTALIGMRIADEVGLTETQRSALYYALLLKDTGCSSNAARMAALFGSADQVVKYRMKLVNWHDRVGLALATARNVGLGRSPTARVRHFLRIARTVDMTRDLIAMRCERGADIVTQLGFPSATAEAIRYLDEHWNGQGYASGMQGVAIPLLARIASLAQTVQLFYGAGGQRAALRMARARRGTWFDPALVDLVLSWADDYGWWAQLRSPDTEAIVVAAEPDSAPRLVDADGLDAIADGFATIIDAKSPYTFRHSARMAAFARGIALQLGYSAADARLLHRAGLLHDIGKLGVSNTILDKPGPLTATERSAVEQHPVHTWEILSRVPAFQSLAWTAALHHEKLDGSGYPWRLKADQLDLSARILAVADIYEALTADRPYRAGMRPDAALAIIERDAGTRLCPEAIAGLRASLVDEAAPEPAQLLVDLVANG